MNKNGHTKVEIKTFLRKEVPYINKEKCVLSKVLAEEITALNGGVITCKGRQLEHPVSATATLMHLLKSCLGTGILAMPFAFKCSGLFVGVVATVFASMICTHCAYILVICAHDLYKRSGKPSLTFADIADEACLRGPPWAKPYSNLARRFVDITIFVTYFGTCSAYTVIIAKNFNKVTAYYWASIDIRLYLLILLIPLLIVVYVPNLKYLAPVSVVSNILMAAGIILTCYYLVNNLPRLDERNLAADLSSFPTFFSITIFALEAIGIVMPLENSMNKPKKFVGICGVLNKGMAIVTFSYIIVGFLGYYHFGELTSPNVTLNLPEDEYAAQAVQISISLAIYGTYGLPFFVCLDIAWQSVKDRFTRRPTLANYILRTVLLVTSILVAVAVPKIGPFIGIMGALCFSILGIILPIIIEIITFWEKGFGPYNWRIFKDIIVVSVGMFAMIFGTKAAIVDIIHMYTGYQNVTGALLNDNVLTTTDASITQLL